MDIKDFLNSVSNQIKYKPVRKGISDELKSHIEEIKEDYVSSGIDESLAEEKAIEQMGDAEEIGKKLNKIHRPKLDWVLLILIVLLIGFGILVSALKEKSSNTSYIINTFFYIGISIVLGIGVYFFDYKKLEKYSFFIYLLATIVMIIPIKRINEVGYIYLGSIRINSSTIALPLYVISFVGFVVNYNKNNKLKIQFKEKEIFINDNLIKIILLPILSIILLIHLPATANAIILVFTYILIITLKLIEHKNKKALIILLGTVFILSMLGIYTLAGIEPYKFSYTFSRLVTSFAPEKDPTDRGYTGMLQKDILENAKMFGEAETDIISSDDYIISKESNFTFIYLLGKTGMIVSGTLVFIVVLTSIKMILNAKFVKEKYGKSLIIGLSILYIIQSVGSILMNLNLGVKMNVDIPFVTYGRLYFIVNSFIVSLMLSVYRRKDIVLYEGEYENEENI